MTADSCQIWISLIQMDSNLLFNKSRKERERLYRTRRPRKREKPETYPLDHNHTHFLMLQDEFGEDDDRDEKPEYRDLFRISLMLDLRAQIEEESRKVLSQGQSKKSRPLPKWFSFHTVQVDS